MTKNLIKNNLLKYRTWKCKTQAQLAKDLNISINQLRMIECKFKYPKYQIRKRLCDFFDISQDQMFYYEKNPKS